MNTFYLTFGQTHVHCMGNITFDRNSVVAIKSETYLEAREKAIALFGKQWGMLYPDRPDMGLFPRGIVHVVQ